ncbi:uncharacterized protein CLAFUR5_04034 [Fulvia fulva]|uniref:F-box domain-containing protein n=1 Tax=Passalora fulva TaxID=5499 RepID=A0A9Q8P8B9_PASFU|nr:uncharacterized protein CLAFUR5_04034 [Fulvia fulva]KAK4628203.1 hypothetical protein CLAFUR0_04058 [Fulvia fulva]UJO16847.1 hypothetical protein CLAFUR5_04034 [Fulvia fulva]
MLLDLPEEIIILILDHLRLPAVDHLDKPRLCNIDIAAALATLAAVSRYCILAQLVLTQHRLVEPIFNRVFPGSRLSSPQLFLAALAINPSRVPLVTEIVLDPTHLETEDADNYNEYGYHDYDYDGRDLLPTHLKGGLTMGMLQATFQTKRLPKLHRMRLLRTISSVCLPYTAAWKKSCLQAS